MISSKAWPCNYKAAPRNEIYLREYMTNIAIGSGYITRRGRYVAVLKFGRMFRVRSYYSSYKS